jgi:hypothetical protein
MLTQDQANAVFQRTIGRNANPWEVEAWNAVGVNPETLGTSLLDTDEYKNRWAGVTAARTALGRDPNETELGSLVAPAGFYRGATGSDLNATASWLTNMLKDSGGGAFSRNGSTAPAPPAPTIVTPITQKAPTQMPGMGGQPDWLGGTLAQLFGGGIANPFSGGAGGGGQYDFGGIWSKGGFAPTPYLGGGMGGGRVDGRQAGGYGGMGRLGDLFGASPGQFGSGAMGAQQTNAMSNPLSASPFGRTFSTRQMGIPARTMI